MENQIDIRFVNTIDGKHVQVTGADLERLSKQTMTVRDEQMRSQSLDVQRLGTMYSKFTRTEAEAADALQTIKSKV